MPHRLLSIALLGVVLGCQAPHVALPTLPRGDEDVNTLRLRRLDQAARRLGVTGIDVALSRRPEPGAWAWPSGPIHVSRSLIDLVDDDELAAAIAHELGHLQADGTWRAPLAALDGPSGDPDAESRADALACRLLALHGVPPTATVRLLEKLTASGGPPRDALTARAAHARGACR